MPAMRAPTTLAAGVLLSALACATSRGEPAPRAPAPARPAAALAADHTPAEMPPEARGLREPDWRGTAPARGAGYAEAAAALQRVAARRDPRLRVTFPAPCVLRITLTQDLSALPEARVRFFHRSTWVDLARVTRLEAEAFGRTPSREPQLAMTCAWFKGAPGFGLRTEIVTLEGASAPLRRSELEDERSPRVCVSNEAEPEELAAPLRQLVKACGGTT